MAGPGCPVPRAVPLTEKRLAAGELNYPGIGSTEHGQPPEGYPCLVSQTYLGDGLAVYRQVARGILSWELQRRSGLLGAGREGEAERGRGPVDVVPGTVHEREGGGPARESDHGGLLSEDDVSRQ